MRSVFHSAAAAIGLAGIAAAQAPAAAATITVTGLLLDDHYRPARGVTLAWLASDSRDVAAALASPLAKSADDGTFRVELQPPAGDRGCLLIGGRGVAVHRVELDPVATTITLEPLTLAPGFDATGRVRTADGKPVVGATVVGSDLLRDQTFLVGIDDRQAICWTAGTTDQRGHFRLPGLVQSLAKVVVSSDGCYDAVAKPVAAGTPLDFTLEPARTVRGHARSFRGQGIAGAIVSAGSTSTTSAADGSFALTLRERTTRYFTVGMPNQPPAKIRTVQVPADDSPIEVRCYDALVHADRSVPIVAVDADGSPIESFDAWVVWASGSDLDFLPSALHFARATRDPTLQAHAAHGSVTLPGPEKAFDFVGALFVRAKGHGWYHNQLSPLANRREPLVAVLPPAMAITGQVVDADGRPVAGVTLVPSHGRVREQLANVAPLTWPSGEVAQSPDAVSSGADGRFRIDGLCAGPLQLFALLDGGLLARPLELDLTPAAPAPPLRVEIPTPRRLRAQLVGTLWPGTRLHLQRQAPDATRPELHPAFALAIDPTHRVGDRTVAPARYSRLLLLPSPPRSGRRPRIDLTTWNAAAAQPDEQQEWQVPSAAFAQGAVGGDVPWHRLGVAVVDLDGPGERHRQEAYSQVAPLTPDRTFCLLLPAAEVDLALVDLATGIPLERRTLAAEELQQPIDWSGNATPLLLELRAAPGVAPDACSVRFETTEQLAARGVRAVVGQAPRHFVLAESAWTTGYDVAMWLPPDGGRLSVHYGVSHAQQLLQPEGPTVRTVTLTQTGVVIDPAR